MCDYIAEIQYMRSLLDVFEPDSRVKVRELLLSSSFSSRGAERDGPLAPTPGQPLSSLPGCSKNDDFAKVLQGILLRYSFYYVQR